MRILFVNEFPKMVYWNSRMIVKSANFRRYYLRNCQNEKETTVTLLSAAWIGMGLWSGEMSYLFLFFDNIVWHLQRFFSDMRQNFYLFIVGEMQL